MSEIRQIFESDYCGIDTFLTQILSPIFGNYNKGYDVLTADKANQANILEIKHAASFDFFGSELKVFDITVGDGKKLENNRVGIQSIVRQYIAQFEGALILFHHQNVKNQEWRFSYVEKRTNAKDSTSAKRYTYILGQNHPAKTITENFKKLEQEKDSLTITDLTTAFSVAPLSDEFFNEYRDHYANLVEYISGKRFVKEGGKFVEKKMQKAIPSFKDAFDSNDKLVRDYVKKMMGRLVFLHFLQKKGWLGVRQGDAWGNGDKNFIYNLFINANEEIKNDFLEKALAPLFFNTLNTDRGDEAIAPAPICNIYGQKIRIPYLNGGLFEEDELDKKKVQFKKEHFEELLNFFSQYNFTIDETDPDDQEIGVDPEMLGKIFENLLEDNKDKGAFYTPKEIVQYMCRESLISYLEEKTKIDSREFVINHISNFTETQKATILDALLNVKVCDPAVGSGAFPMGMLNELLACTQQLIGDTKSRSYLKKHIVKNNIYGVDIEKGAVDIARLRFWLAIIVDENSPSPLPNLDYKIMQGNSLLECYEGIDLSTISTEEILSGKGKNLLGEYEDSDDAWKEAKNAQLAGFKHDLSVYYDIKDHKKKESLQKDIMDYVKERITEKLDFETNIIRNRSKELDARASSIHSQLEGFTQNSKDPVAIKLRKQQDKITKERQKVIEELTVNDEKQKKVLSLAFNNTEFFLWHTWFGDVFNRPNDCNGFDIVIGNPPYIDSETMTNVMPEMREVYSRYFDSAKGNWDMFVIFIEKGMKLAHSKGIYSFIMPNKLIATKYAETLREQLKKTSLIEIRDYSRLPIFVNAAVYPCTIVGKNVEPKDNLLNFIYMESISEFGNFNKIDYQFFKKYEYWDMFFIEKEEFSLLEKILNNSILKKSYEVVGSATVSEAYDIKSILKDSNNVSDSFKMINTGTIDPYLSLWGEKPMQYIKDKYNFPIVDKQDLLKISKTRVEQSESEKIIVAGMSSRIEALYDAGGILAGKSTSIILGKNLKYLLGIINSKLVSYVINIIYSSLKMAGGYLNIGTREIENIPLPETTENEQKTIIKLVEEIISKQIKFEDTSSLITKIDELVYDFYGLSPQEKEIIRKAEI